MALLPKTMKAAVLTGRCRPKMQDVRTDRPVPETGLDEALIRVGACGVNNIDIVVREGG